jgi:hypothetical protein
MEHALCVLGRSVVFGSVPGHWPYPAAQRAELGAAWQTTATVETLAAVMKRLC